MSKTLSLNLETVLSSVSVFHPLLQLHRCVRKRGRFCWWRSFNIRFFALGHGSSFAQGTRQLGLHCEIITILTTLVGTGSKRLHLTLCINKFVVSKEIAVRTQSIRKQPTYLPFDLYNTWSRCKERNRLSCCFTSLAATEQRICISLDVDSIRLAVLIVFPNRQYRRFSSRLHWTQPGLNGTQS